MGDIVFEKTKGCGRTLNGTKIYAEQPSKRFFKKIIMKNFAKFTRKHLCRKNETPAQVFSCEFCEICKNIFFAEHHRRLLLIITVSIVVKGELTA